MITNMCNKKIELLEFPLFTKSFILNEKELKNYGDNLINTLSDDLIKLMRKFKKTIYSIYSNQEITKYPYAIAVFEYDKLVDIYFNLNKFEGATGLRITKRLKDILDMKLDIDFNFRQMIRNELRNYFGKTENNTSKYKSQSNFTIDLVRLKTSLKAIDLSRNTGYQANTNSFGVDIHIDEFIRSLDSKTLAYHRLDIDFLIIEKSLNALSQEYYSIFQLFYFSDRKAKYKKKYDELEDIKESSYDKAWKIKNNAIHSLIDNICNIQFLESEIK